MFKRRHYFGLPLTLLIVLGVFFLRESLYAIEEEFKLTEISNPKYVIAEGGSKDSNAIMIDTLFSVSLGIDEKSYGAGYRVVGSLRSVDDNELIKLDGADQELGPNFVVSKTEDVFLSREKPRLNKIISLSIKPSEPLSVQKSYQVECVLQKSSRAGWIDIFKKSESNQFKVYHFTSTKSGDSEWNVKGSIEDISWGERTYLLKTDSAKDHFDVNVNAILKRFDDWNLPVSSVEVEVIFDYDLVVRDSNKNIDLLNEGIVKNSFPIASYKPTVEGKIPAIRNLSVSHEIVPNEHLDSTKEYILTCNLSYFTNTPKSEIGAGVVNASPQELLYFNGSLYWGSEREDNLITTTIHKLVDSPISLGIQNDHVNVEIKIPNKNGTINENYVFGDGSMIYAHLDSNGNGFVKYGEQIIFDSDGDLLNFADPSHCLDYSFGVVSLSQNGIFTDSISVNLPQGNIYIPDSNISKYRGQGFLSHEGLVELKIEKGLLDLGDSGVTISLGENAKIVDESHPLVFGVSKVDVRSSGRLVYTTVDNQTEYIHRPAFEILENDRTNGQIEVSDESGRKLWTRCSNDLYLRGANVSGDIVISAASDCSSRLSAKIDLASQNFKTHFPYQVGVDWKQGSMVVLEDGSMAPASKLSKVEKIVGDYQQGCSEISCSDDISGKSVKMLPKNMTLSVVSGGGLVNYGTSSSAEALMWGGRGDGNGAISEDYPYAHRTDVFEQLSFYSPGYQLYALKNDFLKSPIYKDQLGDTSPSVLLLSGVSGDPNNHELFSPVQKSYISGLGLYPGFNYEVQDDNPNDGASRLGGSLEDYEYKLMAKGASKYYTRPAGVFGRHVAIENSLSNDLKIYGYDFGLNSFQLTFIGSENEDSWVNGNITVTGHSSFTQDFKELAFDCVGELKDALIDSNDLSDKALVYWNSSFTPRSIRFEKAQLNPGNCPEIYKGLLTMGVSTKVANVPTQLHGVLGFEADDGNLLTQQSGADYRVNSELRLPSNILMEGPEDNYSIVPVSKLRYSNPDGDPNALIGQPGGFVSYAATIDISYFRDLQVHIITSANEGNAPVFLASGWDEGGNNFFNNINFDPNHISWPGPGNGINLEQYKSPIKQTPEKYKIHAEQDLFGLIPVKYPLTWDDTARSFSSMDPKKYNLFVLDIENQIDFLDHSTTQLSFGAKFDGIPQINISNFLHGQIDGAAEAVANAISVPLKDGLDLAFEEFEKHLADSLDDLIDPIVDDIAESVLDPLYEVLKASYAEARRTRSDWDSFVNSMDEQLNAKIYAADGGLTDLEEKLCNLAIAENGLGTLTSDLSKALENVINGIDIINNNVELIPDPQVAEGLVIQFNPDPETVSEMIAGGLADGVKRGILDKNDDGESREIIMKLVVSLLSDLLEPEIAALIEPLINPRNLEFEDPELSAKLNAILNKIDPSLERISQTLSQLREYLVLIHSEINALNGLVGQFDDLVNEAKISVDGFSRIMMQSATRSREYILRAAAENGITQGADEIIMSLNIFDDFSKDDFISSIKTQLKDSITESELMTQYQFLLRQELYDIESSFEQAFASVLNNVSNVMKDLISEVSGVIDEEINGMTGNINDYMGTAEVSGYAHFNGDSIRKIRLDNKMQIKVPDEMILNTYLEILAYNSMDLGNVDQGGCLEDGEELVEITVGADDVPFDWISDDIRASLNFKMSVKNQGSGYGANGVGGGFELTGGTVQFQTFEIDEFAATFAASADECYLGGRASARFDSYEVSAGIFFGKTCDVTPLQLVDDQVGDLFAISEPFTPLVGAYVYGEVWLPISELVLGVPATCFFNISAGVGTGVGFFIDGNDSPAFVGKMFAGISGEALCVVSITGDVSMVGLVQDGSFSASGVGQLSGKAGWCPFCVKFSAMATLSYSNGDWDIDY